MRKTIYFLINVLLIIKIFFGIAIATTKTNNFVAGEHFKILPQNGVIDLKFAGTAPINKPQVFMFFNYGCFGCWLANKDFTAWRSANKNNIDIYYFPVAFNDIWKILAKLYYVNQELQPNDNGEEIFINIHQNRKRLWLEEEMINFYNSKNITQDHFLKIYQSFDVERKVNKSIELCKMYDVHVTPNIIVNVKKHSYMVNFTMVKTPEILFQVIEYLIKNTPRD